MNDLNDTGKITPTPVNPLEDLLQNKPMAVSFGFLLTLLLLMAGGGIWLWMSQLEEAIIAQGQMVPEGNLKRVMAPVSGIVASVLVKEDQIVKAGDVLLELDPESSDIETNSVAKQLEQLRDEANALRAAYRGGGGQVSRSSYGDLQVAWLSASQQTASAEMISASKRIERLEHEHREALKHEQQIISVLEKSEVMLKDYQALYNEGGLSKNELMSYEQKVLEQRGQLATVEETVQAKELALEEATHYPAVLKGNYHQNILNRLTDVEQKIALAESEMEKNNLNKKHHQILAPMDGVIHQLDIHGPKEVIEAGKVVISMVPKGDPLLAEVHVPNTDLSYIHVGQDASMRIDAFPYTQYGPVKGKVIFISPSSIKDGPDKPPYYLVRVRPEKMTMKRGSHEYNIRSGMTLTANLITRNKNVLSFFTDPLTEHIEKAFQDPSNR